MEKAYAPELEAFIQQELSEVHFENEAELLTRALEVYRALKQRHDALRATVNTAIAEADRGEATPLDIETVIAAGYERLTNEGITTD